MRFFSASWSFRSSQTAAVLTCLLFTGTLVDVAWHDVAPSRFVTELPEEGEARTGVLRVEAVDEQGAPVGPGDVAVYAIREEQAYAAGRGTLDPEGHVTFEHLPEGELWVLVEASGRQRASSRMVLLAEPRDLRLTLQPARQLAARVTDDQGTPLARARIEIRGSDPLPWAALTGADGRLEIGRLGSPPWNVEVSLPGYESVKKMGIQPGKPPLELTLRLLGRLEVAVLTPDGSPAPEATLFVGGAALWPARQVTTDGTGHVVVAGLAAGSYDLVAIHGDMVSTTQVGLPLQRGETQSVELRLGPGRRVTVRVVAGEEPDASVVPGAAVVLAEDGVTSFPREGVTHPDGTVILGPIAPGPAFVSARAERFVAGAAVAVDARKTGPVTVVLTAGATLRGDVVDARGFPIAGASIEVVGVDPAGLPVDETPERRGFQAAHFGRALAGPAPLLPAGELGVMPGPVPHLPSLTAFSLPAPWRSPASAPPMESWLTRTDGTFRIQTLPAGRLRALVRHAGYVEALSDAVAVGPGGEAAVHVVLRGGGTLDGRVVDGAGRPVAGARVVLVATYGTLRRSALTADDGTFGFATIPADVTVTVARPETPDESVLRQELTVKEATRNEITLTLPAQREAVNIRVVDERGTGLDAAQVAIASLDPDVPLRTTQFTRGDGTLTIADAAGLPLRLTVSLPGRAPLTRTVDRADRDLTLTLRRGAAIDGDITTRNGREAVAGADVVVSTSTGVRKIHTDKAGHYVLADLSPGPARVVVTHAGHARREVDVTIAEPVRDRPTTLPRIDLEEAGSIEGRVVDGRGDPVPGARVAVGVVAAYLPLGSSPGAGAVTDGNGRFRLSDVAPGTVTMEASSPERGRGRESNVRVRAGRTTAEVRIRLVPGETAGAESSSSGGVAISLEESPGEAAAAIRVVEVAPGSEAERAGLRPGDTIRAIGKEAPGSLADARRRLSGPVGDDIIVRVERRGDEVTFRVPRERVQR